MNYEQKHKEELDKKPFVGFRVARDLTDEDTFSDIVSKNTIELVKLIEDAFEFKTHIENINDTKKVITTAMLKL